MYELEPDKYINLGNVCEILASDKSRGALPFVVHMANGHYHFISHAQRDALIAAMAEFNNFGLETL